MRVLSLFDGISAGYLALKRAGIQVEKYYASEIDRYAISISKKNFPEIIQVGDVTKLNAKDLGRIDLLIGGSPCQGFSFAGKGLNFEDPRSKLFFEYTRILGQTRAKYFLFENVKMKQEYQDIISWHLGIRPIEINSALVSAQNRNRLYWTNIKNISQPIDRKVILQDIIENGIVDREKSYCIDANYFKSGNLKNYFDKGRRQLVFPNLTCGVSRGRYLINGIRQSHKMKTKTLTTIQKDNLLIDRNSLQYRKLTPIECERLQTFPDNYTEGISNTQRYKCLGNSWTVDVIAHIFGHIGKTKPSTGYQYCLFQF